MISRTGAHWGGQAEAEARGAGSAEGESTQQHALACERGRWGWVWMSWAQAPQTLWSQRAAFQTFYELSLTREKERNWVQDSLELQHHGNISHVSQVKPLISADRLTYIIFVDHVRPVGYMENRGMRPKTKSIAASKSYFILVEFSFFISTILTAVDGAVAYY